jgi:hypothetical protein
LRSILLPQNTRCDAPLELQDKAVQKNKIDTDCGSKCAVEKQRKHYSTQLELDYKLSVTSKGPIKSA